MTKPAALEDLAWTDDAQDWLESWAWSGIPITADDMRQLFRPPPHPNMVGAAFRTASQAGVIKHVRYIESTAPSRHGAIIRVWVGTNPAPTPQGETA